MAQQQGLAPNQYHLHGGGIQVSYFPGGSGPVIADKGRLHFTYQDAHHSLAFYGGDDVRTVEVADLGTVVSVTVVRTVDIGYTSFSLLVPRVQLPSSAQGPTPVQTEGITTVHRAFVGLIGHAQAETYTATHLVGTASAGPLPL